MITSSTTCSIGSILEGEGKKEEGAKQGLAIHYTFAFFILDHTPHLSPGLNLDLLCPNPMWRLHPTVSLNPTISFPLGTALQR